MPKVPPTAKPRMLPIKVRVIIGLMSLPSLLLTAFLIKTALDGNWDTVDAFEVIYALVGIFAAYIALSGRRFF